MLRPFLVLSLAAGAVFAQDDSRQAALLSKQAMEQQAQGHPAEAVELYTRALRIQERGAGAHSTEVAAALNNLGVALRADGKSREAEPVFRQALTIVEEAGQGRLLATVLGGLGATLVDLGELDRAEPVLRRSLAIFETAAGPQSVEAAEAGNNLAMLYRSNGHLARAQEQMERSLPLMEKGLGAKDPEFAKALNGMFVILAEQDQWDRAEPYLRRALQIGEQVFPGSMPMAEFRENLALVAAHRGQYQAAAALMGDAIAEKEQLLGDNDPQLVDSLVSYSGYLKKINQKAEARRVEEKAREIRKGF